MNKTEKKTYENAVEMFDGVCALCGNPSIHLHHNRLVHTNKHLYQPILIEIIERRIETYDRVNKIHDTDSACNEEESSTDSDI